MSDDLLADLGHLFLGSRLKRLAERLQTDAAKVHRDCGVDAQPAELGVMAALDRLGPQSVSGVVDALGLSQPAITRTVGGLVDRGLLTTEANPTDQRQRVLKLTSTGRALVRRAKRDVWPRLADAVATMCEPLEGTLLDQITALERQLEACSLETRALVTLREFEDALAPDFYAINAEWIASMFALEEIDRRVLSHPRREIIDPGGVILFAETRDLGVVGTCALMKIDDGVFELTKMGVLEKARGRGVGELLLVRTLDRAEAMKVGTLFLLTNSACTTAIRLYERHGFVHDAGIMKAYGAEYERCDVAMRYVGRR